MSAVAPIPLAYSEGNAHPLSEYIRLGTSSWTHQFWKGQIYHKQYKSEKEFNLLSLKEYAELGMFQMVEIDSTFYTPPKEETLEKYASLVPENFKFIAKIWERLSIPIFPDAARYGKLRGLENPDFLCADFFLNNFLPPFRNSEFSKKLACLLIQFPRMPSAFVRSDIFFSKLELFLQRFPADISLAIEIRNRELLNLRYFKLLNSYRATHCFNVWQHMPPILEQMKAAAVAGGLESSLFVARLVTPIGVSFDEARQLFEPFYEIKRRDEGSRQDIVRLARRALQKEVPAYVIVNNRFEGNSPQTVLELRGLLANTLSQGSGLAQTTS